MEIEKNQHTIQTKINRGEKKQLKTILKIVLCIAFLILVVMAVGQYITWLIPTIIADIMLGVNFVASFFMAGLYQTIATAGICVTVAVLAVKGAFSFLKKMNRTMTSSVPVTYMGAPSVQTPVGVGLSGTQLVVEEKKN